MAKWLTRKSRMWQLGSLSDFAMVARWLESKRQNGQQYAGISQYLQHTTPMLDTSIDEYLQCAEELDMLAGGLYSSNIYADDLRKTLTESEPAPLQTLHKIGKELREFFDRLKTSRSSQFTTQWLEILNSKQHYHFLLRRLVGDFGNFEVLIPILPPTGEIITNPKIQSLLQKMYEINTRNIRILELIHDTCKSWRKNPARPNYGFMDPRTYCNQLIGSMLLEYMIEADPVRIRKKKASAQQEGRPFSAYRFWRPAENLKLMAQVKYSNDEFRKPQSTRRYVDLQLDYVKPIGADSKRFQWSLREIFNNCLAASSKMYIGPTGKWLARPLARHDCENPSPAITISLDETRFRKGLRKRPALKLTIRDEGVGIPPEHLPYLTYWGYSPRREEFLRQAKESQKFRDILGQEIKIGGKGIGLAFANAVIREHGGTIEITSQVNEGTTTTVTLPIPTSLAL